MSSPRTDSTSRLILLPNTDDDDRVQHTTDDDQDEHEVAGSLPAINQLPIPPLPPSAVFLYLLSPYLRLGAIYASDVRGTSLAYSLAGLVVAATLSAFCRNIWFLLGRYLRTSSTEDILIYTFTRPHRRVRKYGSARYTFTIVSASFRILLAAMYLRDSVHSALLLKLPESFPFPSHFNTSILLSILVFVLSLSKSLASKSTLYTTALSVASYLTWLVAVYCSYGANELSQPASSSFRRGVLWNEISLYFTYTFASTTALTVPLSASLIAGTPLTPPPSRTRSFELLNVFSTMLAILLLFPLVFIVASPRTPASTPSSNNLVLGLRVATLVFSIPSVVVSIISLPLYGAVHRFIHSDLALSVITVAIFAVSLVPPTIASILDDSMLVLAAFGTFLLPALVHTTIHYFRRPLAIVVSQEPSSAPSTPRTPNTERSPPPSHDPLLQRKERLLQRSRLGKRLLWDIVIWIVLMPICACASVWAVGRLARQW